MGSDDERQKFLEQVAKAAASPSGLRELGIRPYGVVRIDSATGVADWAKGDCEGQQPPHRRHPSRKPARSPKILASAWPPKERFAGAACTVGNACCNCSRWLAARRRSAFRPTWPHTLLYVLGLNAPEDAILPADFNWKDTAKLDEALEKLTSALRPLDDRTFTWRRTDATVHGTGSHDKTGRHCLPNDPNAKLDIVKVAGFWLRNDQGQLTQKFRHICLGRLHVPQQDDARSQNLEQHSRRDDRGSRTHTAGANDRLNDQPRSGNVPISSHLRYSRTQCPNL